MNDELLASLLASVPGATATEEQIWRECEIVSQDFHHLGSICWQFIFLEQQNKEFYAYNPLTQNCVHIQQLPLVVKIRCVEVLPTGELYVVACISASNPQPVMGIYNYRLCDMHIII